MHDRFKKSHVLNYTMIETPSLMHNILTSQNLMELRDDLP